MPLTQRRDGATWPKKKFDDIFSRLDKIHERDRQTDRQTPADSKDRAYAWRRRVKITITVQVNDSNRLTNAPATDASIDGQAWLGRAVFTQKQVLALVLPDDLN